VSQEELSNYVFVYGTLKRGGQLHDYLNNEEAQFITEYTVPKSKKYELKIPDPKKYVMIGFPAIVTSKEGAEFKGEVYKVSDYIMSVLDMVEGVPHLYNRRYMYLDIGKKKVKTYFYVANPSAIKPDKLNMITAKEYPID
jgi:gamma-glutamylcyclotransferase (GGCT)/AIG2-like uncharacterized protein YtfP